MDRESEEYSSRGIVCHTKGVNYSMESKKYSSKYDIHYSEGKVYPLSEPRYPLKHQNAHLQMLYQISGYTYLRDFQDILHIYLQSGKSYHRGYRGSDNKKHYFCYTDNAADIVKSSLHHKKGIEVQTIEKEFKPN